MNLENNSPKEIGNRSTQIDNFQPNLFERTQSSVPISYKLFLLIKLVFAVIQVRFSVFVMFLANIGSKKETYQEPRECQPQFCEEISQHTFHMKQSPSEIQRSLLWVHFTFANLEIVNFTHSES